MCVAQAILVSAGRRRRRPALQPWRRQRREVCRRGSSGGGGGTTHRLWREGRSTAVSHSSDGGVGSGVGGGTDDGFGAASGGPAEGGLAGLGRQLEALAAAIVRPLETELRLLRAAVAAAAGDSRAAGGEGNPLPGPQLWSSAVEAPL